MSDDWFDDAPVPIEAQIQCVKRELSFRERVYKRRITNGAMTQELADREIRAMKAVLKTLESTRSSKGTVLES